MEGNLFVDKALRGENVYARNEAHYKPLPKHSGVRNEEEENDATKRR